MLSLLPFKNNSVTIKLKSVISFHICYDIIKHYQYGGASTYNVEILNSFKSELWILLQLTDAESAIKNNFKNSLFEIRDFKFV